MRFPIRDLVPTRTRPMLTALLALVSLAGQVRWDMGWAGVVLISAQVVPLLVLGETVEDQLGRVRYLLLVVSATAIGAWVDRPGASELTWLLYASAGVIAAHAGMFPLSRAAVSLWVTVIEVPTFAFAGTWLIAAILTAAPDLNVTVLSGTLCALAVGALAGRWGVPPARRSWDYLDSTHETKSV